MEWADQLQRMVVGVDGDTFYPEFLEPVATQQMSEHHKLLFAHQLELQNAYGNLRPFPTMFAPGNICNVDFVFTS
jgi:hypothetical protein